jgi:hypothetical protein
MRNHALFARICQAQASGSSLAAHLRGSGPHVRGCFTVDLCLPPRSGPHWFVTGIPETAPVGTVRQAKEALKQGRRASVG